MSNQILSEISNKLDVVVRWIASKSIEGKSETDGVLTLGALGIDRNLISEIVGTTRKTVDARLAEVKRRIESSGRRVSEEG